jgi:hypothetical protein
LAAAGYDHKKANKEWKNVRPHEKQQIPGKSALQVWKSMLLYKNTEFPIICLRVEIVFSLSGSNSSVERAFSILTVMLTDRRLKSSHALLEMRMLIKINDKNWSKIEREEILKRPLDIYMSKKRRKRKLDEEAPVASSVLLDDTETTDSEDSDSDEYDFDLF